MDIQDVIDFLITEAEKSQTTTLAEQHILYDAAAVVKRHEGYFRKIYG